MIFFKSKRGVKYNRQFVKSFNLFRKEANSSVNRFNLSWEDISLLLFNDNTTLTSFDPHYVYHTAWAARIVKIINPSFHVDISSYLYFSTLISAFVPIKFYDFRPAKIKLSNLNYTALIYVNYILKATQLNLFLVCM